jgi:hypothetical protein
MAAWVVVWWVSETMVVFSCWLGGRLETERELIDRAGTAGWKARWCIWSASNLDGIWPRVILSGAGRCAIRRRPMCDPELGGVDHEQSGCDLVWSIALETENGIVLTRQETLVALHMLRCTLQFTCAKSLMSDVAVSLPTGGSSALACVA